MVLILISYGKRAVTNLIYLRKAAFKMSDLRQLQIYTSYTIQVIPNYIKPTVFLYTCATCSELPSHINTMGITHK